MMLLHAPESTPIPELGGGFLVEGVGAEGVCDGTLSIPDLGKSQIIRGHEPHA